MVGKRWKAVVLTKSIYKSLLLKSKSKFSKIHGRDLRLVKDFLGLNFSCHNGRGFENLVIKDSLIGHKIGCFSSTRKSFKQRSSKAKKK